MRTLTTLIIGLVLGAAVAALGASDPCSTPTAPPSAQGTTRANPVPLGDWIPDNRGDMTGQFRVTSAQVVTDVTGYTFDLLGVTPGAPYLAVTVEYTCQADPDTPCSLGDVVNAAKRVSDEGRVLALVGTSDSLHSASFPFSFDLTNAQVYAPLTVSGVLYFDMTEGDAPGLLRMRFDLFGDYSYFALLAG